MTLQACVLSPLHTKSSIFPSSSARDHVTAEEKKNCCHVCILRWQRFSHYKALKCPGGKKAPYFPTWPRLLPVTCNLAFWAQFPTQETTFSSRSISNPVRSWACNHSHSWLVENYQLTSYRQMNGPCTSSCHTNHPSPCMWQVSYLEYITLKWNRSVAADLSGKICNCAPAFHPYVQLMHV